MICYVNGSSNVRLEPSHESSTNFSFRHYCEFVSLSDFSRDRHVVSYVFLVHFVLRIVPLIVLWDLGREMFVASSRRVSRRVCIRIIVVLALLSRWTAASVRGMRPSQQSEIVAVELHEGSPNEFSSVEQLRRRSRADRGGSESEERATTR